MRVEIYQIKDVENTPYAYIGWGKSAEENFDFSDYEKTYEYIADSKNKTDFDMLEKVFEKFNCNNPSDFKSRSLSVSDIVRLDDKYYYCDNIGWTDVTYDCYIPKLNEDFSN